MTTPNTARVSCAVAGATAILGGLAWLLLIPAAELHRRDLLTYDDYNRLLAVPLTMFLVALLAAPRILAAPGLVARSGFLTVATGLGLLLAGTLVEFYGVLLQDKPNAHTAVGASNHWIGSDIGWIIFAIGMLVLLTGGLITAAGLRRHRTRPFWVVLFTATLGVGVLAANLFALQSAILSVPVLGLYAGGWIAYGLHVLKRLIDAGGSDLLAAGPAGERPVSSVRHGARQRTGVPPKADQD